MKKGYHPYKKNLKQFSRDLRNFSTYSEVLLWNELKAGKLRGYKFNRQKPLITYIVDFYSKKLNLVIEIDGVTHFEKENADTLRQKELEKLNLNFLRFNDLEVKEDLSNVIMKIEEYIDNFESESP